MHLYNSNFDIDTNLLLNKYNIKLIFNTNFNLPLSNLNN
jgi:hypothetical protein